MEIVGQPSPAAAAGNLLGVPGLVSVDADDDEGEVVIGIRPKSSPLPRRRTSVSDDDSDFEPPPSGSRRVSFADAKGLSLVQVKEFDTWDVPKLPGYESSEGEGNDAEEYFLALLSFARPLPTDELFANVREQKAELEALELVPGTTILKGVIRVLNISFNKAVYIRTTLDSWSTHFDLLAEYVPGSSDGVTDCFSFRLTLVPPFGEQGVRVDFCLRYETSVGTFWANNNNRNYIFACHHRKVEEPKKPQRDSVNKKSCLKTVSQNFSDAENSSAKEDQAQGNNSTGVSNHVEVQTPPKTCNDHSGASEQREQKLQMENRHNSSRRSRRKAARMARVKQYFAQRGAEGNDSEREESPPETKQAPAQEGPEGKGTNADSRPAGKQAEAAPFACDSLDRCGETLRDNTSPSHDGVPNGESVKPESITVADPATLPGGAAQIEDKLLSLDNEPSPEEQPTTKEAVAEAEEQTPTRVESGACADSPAPVSSDSLVSQTECFTFGTVVAPLYQQVFGSVASDGHRLADWGSPARTAVINADLNVHTERGQNSCTDPRDATSETCQTEGSTETDRETDLRFSEPALNDALHQDETSWNQTMNGVLDRVETSAELLEQEHESELHVPKTVPEEMFILPQTRKISLNKGLLNSLKPPENTHLQDDALEEEGISDLHIQTTAERLQHQQPNHADTQTVTDKDESQKGLNSSIAPSQPVQNVSEPNVEEMNQQNSSRGENNNMSEDLIEAHHICSTLVPSEASLKDDRFTNMTHDSSSQETVSPLMSCSEPEEEKDLTTLEETQTKRGTQKLDKEGTCCSGGDETNPSDGMKGLNEDDEEMTETVTNTVDGGNMLVGYKEETTESKQDEDLTDDTEVQNWEAMVEEEENNIIISVEESEIGNTKTEDFKPIEEEIKEGENKVTEKEIKQANTVGVGEEKEATWSEDEEQTEREETVGAEESQEAARQLDYVRVSNAAKTAEEEELAGLTDGEKTEEPGDNEESCTENLSEGEKRDRKEENETNLNSKDVAGVKWEDQMKPKEENEKSPSFREETTAVHAEEDETYMVLHDGEVEVETEEEEELNIPVNTAEGGQEVISEREGEKEDKGAQNEQNPTDVHLHEADEEPQSDGKATPNQRNDDGRAADGDARVVADEPEDQDGASTESDSDDEVELYMHCLRAVSAGAQAQKDRGGDAGFNAGKRPSISRSRRLSTPMPSISESLDEEQPLCGIAEKQDDAAPATTAAVTASGGQEGLEQKISWWKDTFSCSNISKTLLYATLLAVFLVVAYHYDFLACFVLYLMSVVWLYCQGERQPPKNNSRIE